MAHIYERLISAKASSYFGSKVRFPLRDVKVQRQTKALDIIELQIATDGSFLQSLGVEKVHQFADWLNANRGAEVQNIRVQNDAGKCYLSAQVNRCELSKHTLDHAALVPNVTDLEARKILVEFSSPNMAKPFHAGHLRSTIIGNFIANIHEHCGHQVTRLNYLGDWGTNFGYLALGVRLKQFTEEQIRKDPINSLYEAYVCAHQAAASDERYQTMARETFARLEAGNAAEKQSWDQYRAYTVAELDGLYRRLGVSFTSYEWESQYNVHVIRHLMDRLEGDGIVTTQADGRKVVTVSDRTVPVIKSDGSSMYLARDVAALVDRYDRYGFDRCLYVVENGQGDHFQALVGIAQQMQLPCAGDIQHVKFGRIHGMSTRKGTAVFLKDILNEAVDLMREKQQNSKTTKVDVHKDPAVSETIATTAVIISDLKQRRMKDYNFDWNNVLKLDSDAGVKLQYTHCRLHSMLTLQDAHDGISYDSRHLLEPEAVNLVLDLANFTPTIAQAQSSLEACVLVNYLLKLCKTVNVALRVLPVKHETSTERRQQRILLFHRARQVLHTGLSILGIRPLNAM